MLQPSPQVLLVGTSFEKSTLLADKLRSWGCVHAVANSYSHASQLLVQERFFLVLSDIHLPDSSGLALIPKLTGEPASLFFPVATETGCLWLPAIRSGRDKWGSPAIPNQEFARTVKDLIHESTHIHTNIYPPRPSRPHLRARVVAA
jgi:CheY-like chemotaxis protein